ncbi:alpha/beta hydrolase [Levilactobacillus bambusae]|nr:alpha/beta hydrolase [Levilactobacillus bambusae]
MQTFVNPLKLKDSAASLHAYLHDKTNPSSSTENRLPAVIIVPGGAYTHIPETQAEDLALAFYNQGYQAFYLRYSFLGESQPLMPKPIVELSSAIKMLRDHAGEWKLNPARIATAGFSVGGHIAALQNDYWQAEWLANDATASNDQIKPDAVILSYPVISPQLGYPTEQSTIEKWSANPTAIAADLHVSQQNSPTFIWGTSDDPTVPVANALAYINALSQAKVPFEAHLFDHGPHGLALANQVTAWEPEANSPHVAHWLNLALEWLDHVWDNQPDD